LRQQIFLAPASAFVFNGALRESGLAKFQGRAM
jgi:hypothetical protein